MILKKSLLLAVSLVISVFFELNYFNFSLAGSNLIGSITLGVAAKSGAIIGNDIIMDYGPLGGLATRFLLGISTSKLFLLIY